MSKFKILISNDDGIQADGLINLCIALKKNPEYDIRVAAPKFEQSAQSHCISVRDLLYSEPFKFSMEPLKNTIGLAVIGSPADSVRIGLTQFSQEEGWIPNLVISGINRGANTSLSCIYSGTVAAALEGVVQGYPSIALSLNKPQTYPSRKDSWPYDFAANNVLPLVEEVATRLKKGEIFPRVILNVNIPNIEPSNWKGFYLTKQGFSNWGDKYKLVEVHGEEYGRKGWSTFGDWKLLDSEGYDSFEVEQGWTTITPLGLLLDINHSYSFESLKEWKIFSKIFDSSPQNSFHLKENTKEVEGTSNKNKPQIKRNSTNESSSEPFIQIDESTSKKANITEEFSTQIQEFFSDPNYYSLVFPSSLSNTQRREIHEYVERASGLLSISLGTGLDRHIVVIKNDKVSLKKTVFSLSLRRRFLKEFSLPIPLAESPYFEYFLDLYQNLYQSQDKLAYLISDITKLGSESNFHAHINDVVKKFTTTVKSNPAYSDYLNDKMEKYNIHSSDPFFSIRSGTIYEAKNNQKFFLSLDIKSSNFNSFRFYNPKILFDYPTYEKLISHFSSSQVLLKSKHYRQVLFGHLNMKNLKPVTQYLMRKLYIELLEAKLCSHSHFVNRLEDELLLKADDLDSLYSKYIQIANFIKNQMKMDSIFRIVPFKLVQLADKPFFAREKYLKWNETTNPRNDEIDVDFKGIPVHYFPQCYKYYFKLPLHPYDKKFSFNESIASLEDDLFPQLIKA